MTKGTLTGGVQPGVAMLGRLPPLALLARTFNVLRPVLIHPISHDSSDQVAPLEQFEINSSNHACTVSAPAGFFVCCIGHVVDGESCVVCEEAAREPGRAAAVAHRGRADASSLSQLKRVLCSLLTPGSSNLQPRQQCSQQVLPDRQQLARQQRATAGLSKNKGGSATSCHPSALSLSTGPLLT